MHDLPPPFRFDLRVLLKNSKRKLTTRIDGVSINLPFISFRVKPDDLERRVAREIVIRMADRRVLDSRECCDDCIDEALASLAEIRAMLVNKQVELSQVTDGALYLLIEVQLEAIRQFLTFEQRLKRQPASRMVVASRGDFWRAPDARNQYFAALEMLRAHLHRCLVQIARIADMPIPKIRDHMRYDEIWQIDAYEKIDP
ncbi:MAG: hypothetical protein IRZ28_17550 [Steroidobacteraceae bacterium]|nr:hypothetical protein [Steroidobacteraceae bacterium]